MSGVITHTVQEVARLKCNAKGCTQRWQSKPFPPGDGRAYRTCAPAFTRGWCIALNNKARPVTFCPKHSHIAVEQDMRPVSGPIGNESREAWLERQRLKFESEEA